MLLCVLISEQLDLICNFRNKMIHLFCSCFQWFRISVTAVINIGFRSFKFDERVSFLGCLYDNFISVSCSKKTYVGFTKCKDLTVSYYGEPVTTDLVTQ